MTDERTPWQPDQRKMGNWTSMFDRQERDGSPPAQSVAPAIEAPSEADAPALDLTEYRPWQLQRGRSRPALMLALRRFDPKSGLWRGWALAYPSLYAVEHLGDRMVSLDFGGTRQFVVEGHGLDVLADHLQQGIVLNIVEYAASIWPTAGAAIVTGIQCLGQTGNAA
jgi:hypothetical protein